MRSLVIFDPPRDMTAKELKRVCQEAAGGVPIMSYNLKDAFFINYFSTAHAEEAFDALKDKFTVRYCKRQGGDEVNIVLQNSCHKEMVEKHFGRLVQEYSVSGFQLTRRGAFEWMAQFDDLRDAEHVTDRLNGLRYDGGVLKTRRELPSGRALRPGRTEKEESDRAVRRDLTERPSKKHKQHN